MLKKILPLAISALFISQVQAQSEQCASDYVLKKMLQNQPEAGKILEANEEKIQQHLKTKSFLKAGETVYTIPLVIHIIHTGEAVGVGNNISDAQILSGIQQLNDAFRNTNGMGIDLEIEFALAKIDENCQPTTGIVRVDGSSVAEYASMGVEVNTTSGADEVLIKDLSRWSNNDYYNIWLVSEFDNNNGGNGTQGFAYFPTSSSSIDGAMIMNTAWGNVGTANSWNNQGKTGIHEIGHALNLFHTFEGDNGGAACPSDGCGSGLGDCCDDTSPHIRSNSNCLTSANNTCTGLTNDDVIHNYMDYSSQNCQYMFTQDQKDRMRAALLVNRSGLITSKVLSNYSHSFTAPIAAACTPTTGALGLSGSYIGILQVDFGNLSYSSNYANTDGGYLDATAECLRTAEMDIDSSYYFKVNVGLNNNNVKAWLDYNNDGSFNETTELIFSKNLTANSTDSILVTNPSSSTTDTYLRLRVMADNGFNSVANSCDDPTYGQAEDYAVYISSTPLGIKSDKVSAKATFSVSPNPFNNQIKLSNLGSSKGCYQIVDLRGAIVSQGIIPSETAEFIIPTSDLKSGSYVFILQNSEGQQSSKLVKIF